MGGDKPMAVGTAWRIARISLFPYYHHVFRAPTGQRTVGRDAVLETLRLLVRVFRGRAPGDAGLDTRTYCRPCSLCVSMATAASRFHGHCSNYAFRLVEIPEANPATQRRSTGYFKLGAKEDGGALGALSLMGSRGNSVFQFLIAQTGPLSRDRQALNSIATKSDLDLMPSYSSPMKYNRLLQQVGNTGDKQGLFSFSASQGS